MPGAFEKTDATKSFVFTRVVQNTDYILKTPEGRAMATAQALGVDISSLFGARKPLIAPPDNTAEESGDDTAPAETLNLATQAATDDADFPDDSKDDQPEAKFERLTTTLEEYMSFKEYLDVTTKSGTNPYKLAQKELDSQTATEESRTKMIKRLREFLIAKNVPGVA
jgi:hypothetical protein